MLMFAFFLQRYYGTAIGKAKQIAKTEIEKLKLEELGAREALFEISKIIHTCHDDVKDKDFELELSWMCEETGGVHKLVPKEMRDEISKKAKEALEEEDEESEEEEDEEE